MSNFKNINEEVFNLEDVYTEKVSKKLFGLLLVAGVFALIASTRMTEVEILGVLLFCVAFGMIVMGFVGLSRPAEVIYCKHTKEPLVKQVIYFDSADKDKVRTAIKQGDKELLKQVSDGQQNNMRAIVYATPSYKYSVFQIQTFVPHEYVPVEEPVIYSTCRAN